MNTVKCQFSWAQMNNGLQIISTQEHIFKDIGEIFDILYLRILTF